MWYEQLCKHTEWLVADCLLHIFESCWNPVSLSWGFSLLDLTCLHLVGSSFEMFAGKVRFELRLVHFGHLAAVHHSWRTLSPYLHVGLQGRDWHWTIECDYWPFPFCTPLQSCRHLNLSLAIRFHFSPVNKKSKSSREKWVARWWKPLSQATPRSGWS